ncbi:DUF6332 family protein [Streptomyces sp. NPDC056309]|uniref:DUF6332 family protein n=1 Tax=unclassified Streptomyces TaxID=2593676 RepID=UPI0035DB5B70
MATRSQAERDATTVEIVYAFVSAVFLACVTGLLLASPILFLGLRGPAMKIVGGIAVVFAIGVLLWRLISVLWRFDNQRRH